MAEIEKKPDNALSAGKDAAWWVKEIARSCRDWDDPRNNGRDVVKRYRDERKDEADKKRKQFNILFSNTETLKPAVYARTPVPDIRRRWQSKDPVGRLAALVLQRATSFCMESYDFDSVLKRAVMDYLLPGFAVARVVYKPYFNKEQTQVIYQETSSDYVPWDMFAMSRSKTYERVWWGAVADDLTKDEVKTQFGADVAEALSYGRKDDGDEKSEADDSGKCRVWEVWNKRGRSRFYVAEGYDKFVKAPEADPLRLERFFPWPKPLWSVSTNNTLKPSPEYLQYQDQALELDDLTERIDVLTSALRRRGVYAADEKDTLQGIANSTTDNDFKPVENWLAFVEKGGLANVIAEMPIDGLAAVILHLEERREKVKQTIYEVTGIADIVRGSSNPNETLGAQQLKGKWAGLRISTRQGDFAGFARDIVRLKAEIIAERFDPKTLALMSGLELPYKEQKDQWTQAQAVAAQQAQMAAQQAQATGQPAQPPQPPNQKEVDFYAQPTWEEVVQVLRDDKLRGFKIDIETDSTVQPDADAEKAARNELLQSLGGFSQQMAAAVQAGLVPKKLAISAIQFTLRAYKVGSEFEEELDSMSEETGPTPQQQQMQQQLQQKEQQLQQQAQEVEKRAQAAKDAEHQAQLAKKDLEKREAELQAREDLNALMQKMEAEVQQLREAHQDEVASVVQQAEEAIRQAVASLPVPQGGQGEAAEKPARSGGGGGTIHIHTGGGGKRTPRKFRMADADDGSTTLEEMVEEAQQPGATG